MSVLGIRRFNDVLDVSIATLNEPLNINVEGVYLYNDPEPLPFTSLQLSNIDISNIDPNAIAQIVGIPADDNSLFPIYINGYSEGTIYEHEWGAVIMGWADEETARLINITKCEDETAKAWLLANTEAIGETEDTIYTEKSSWYKSVADAIRSKKGTTDPILRDDFASEISSITGGGETPYYDGTVVIEKAESVLGLRRFKETITLLNDSTYIAKGNADILLSGAPLSLAFDRIDFATDNGNRYFSLYVTSMTPDTVVSLPKDFGLFENDRWLTDTPPTINVTECNDETLKEWLLANTEGVSF